MSYTKGPWHVEERDHHLGLVIRFGMMPLAEMWLVGQPEVERRANARLMAAAPDLLGALQDSVDRMRSQLILLKCDDEFIDRETATARAAIAKATGEGA